MKLNPFNGTFGLPPQSFVSDSAIINSMPVMEIKPGKPNFKSGLTLFRVEDDFATYSKLLSNLGFELPDKSIKLAFIADNFPSDTFTNEYGESFLQKFTDVASQGVQQIVQMTGARTATGAARNLGNALGDIGKETGGMIGDIFSGAGSAFKTSGEALQNLKTALQKNTVMGGAANIVDKMLGGSRVDFPMIWRNSAYSPSYSVTIRLYNPNPGNYNDTLSYIVGPLAAILCLGIPRSDDGKTFNWPFFHKVKCPGIYNLDPSVITNITVVKGGDQQQIAFNQALSMVDVRIDFTSLYSTMLLEEGSSNESSRPTVKNYLDSLLDISGAYTRNDMIKDSANAAGVNIEVQTTNNLTISEEQNIAKNRASVNRSTPTVQSQQLGNRESTSNINKENDLLSRSPSNGIIFT